MRNIPALLLAISLTTVTGLTRADLPPSDGTKYVGYGFNVTGLPADRVFFAYPCSMSSGAPMMELVKLVEGQNVSVGRRGGGCPIYSATKEVFDVNVATPDKLVKQAVACTGAPSPVFTLPSKDPRPGVTEHLKVTSSTPTACALTSDGIPPSAQSSSGSGNPSPAPDGGKKSGCSIAYGAYSGGMDPLFFVVAFGAAGAVFLRRRRAVAVGSAALALALHLGCGSDDGGSKFTDGANKDAGAGDGSSTAPPPASLGGDGNEDSGAGGPLGDVEAVITTDNAFSFGYGSGDALATFIQGVPSGGGAIFDCPVDYGPEPFVVPAAQAPAGSFLYIIAWADENVTQGTLAQFKRTGGSPIYSGDGNWQVCATGDQFDGAGNGPGQDVVNDYIAKCNAGQGGETYSKGWVTTAGALTPGALGKLAFGETNESNEGAFPITCQVDDAGVHGIDAQAKWMWFDPQDGNSPFVGNAGNRTKTFLLFRLPADVLVSVQ